MKDKNGRVVKHGDKVLVAGYIYRAEQLEGDNFVFRCKTNNRDIFLRVWTGEDEEILDT